MSQQKKLLLSVIIGKDSISPNDIQTLIFTVTDSNTGQPINGADIRCSSASHDELKFIVYTDMAGNASYSWQIPSSRVSGIYNLFIWVNASGYDTEMYFKDFEVK